MERITVVDSRSQARTFFFRVDETKNQGRPVRTYFVALSDPPDLQDDFFVARFECVSDDIWQVMMLENRGKAHYTQKGLTPAFLARCATDTGGRIQSSSNNSAHQACDSEWRTDDASRVWQTLVKRGLAQYIPDADRFRLFPQNFDQRITVHEAGHAAVVQGLGGIINNIWLRRNHSALSGGNLIEGRVNWDIRTLSPPKFEDLWAESICRIAVAVAGPIAETLFCGRGDGLASDYRRANAICLLWGLTEDEGNEIQKRVAEYVVKIESPIKALAARLASLAQDSVPNDKLDEIASFLSQDEPYVRRGGLLTGREAKEALEQAGLTLRESEISPCPKRIAAQNINIEQYAKRLRELG